MISAIVFTGWPQEAQYIKTCLESIKWCDEIIAVLGKPQEETLSIIKKYTSKTVLDDSDNIAQHHNLGIEKAQGDWLLFIDADERISQQLKQEIESEIKNPKFDSYKISRVNYYLGKRVRYGDRYPDTVTRLFKKDKLKGWRGEIHESSVVEGSTGMLVQPMFHLTHRDILSMLEKTILFSTLEAKIRYEANHPKVVWWRLLRVILTEFYHRIIRLQGFRQGTEGWIDGLLQTFSVFVIYAKLWEMQRHPSLDETYQELDKKIEQQGTL